MGIGIDCHTSGSKSMGIGMDIHTGMRYSDGIEWIFYCAIYTYTLISNQEVIQGIYRASQIKQKKP